MAERNRKSPKKASQLERATAGTPISLKKPNSARKSKPSVATVVVQEINPVGGFAKFIKDYGVVGVAVGFAIASQAQVLIKSLIDNVITPVYALIFNTGDPKTQTLVMHFRDHPIQELKWGAFTTQLLNFLFVLATIYMIIKVLKLDKLDKKDDDKKK